MAIKVGLDIIYTPNTANPAIVASKMEEVGFESLWFGEHPFIPVSYATPYPSTPDGRIPSFYHQMCDPFVGLACAAAVTKTIKLATGICLVAERNPLFLAKEVATLDHISDGRVIFGAGAGWLREEADIMGVDFSRRHLRFTESIQAMREIWTKDEAEFHGKVIDFPAVRCEPKPVQKPYPPVHLGTSGENGLKRVAQWADGWCPVRGRPSDEMREEVKRLRALTEEAGRDPDKIEISVFAVITEASPVADIIRQWEEIGVHRVVLSLVADEAQSYTAYRFDKFAPDQVEATLEWMAESSVAKL